ncbi:MAG: hypothetical protein JWO38_4435 [Gemmataceae bacterium]|nr:hypothetical protein [Gemmataceae bacterium]
MKRGRFRLVAITAAIGSAGLLLTTAPASAPPAPVARPPEVSITLAQPGAATPVPKPVIDSPQIPPDVSIPGTFMGNPIAFFDDYSWRAFIAVVWPGLKNQRGQPDTAAGVTVGSPGPRVFETYKALWEVFHNDGSAPAGWNAFEPKQYNPCGVDTGWGDLTLGSFSKFGDLGQAGFGTLVGPLVAQPAADPTYVRFMTAYNQGAFDFIMNPTGAMPPKPLYLRANLVAANPVTFPNGSLDIKAAWMDMSHAAHPERYYTRKAFVLDPATGRTSDLTVGLVGLHIVQKTPSRPQWIWTTFEQVDTVPPAAPGAPGTFAFNDGTPAPMPAKNPFPLNPLKEPPPPPFNVTRVKPIHDSTVQTNQAYQAALKGTIWANYQLVMTQWPLVPKMPNLPGTPDQTFPGFPAGKNDVTAFANTTMETFDQGNVRTGCMNCHNLTKNQSDFIWSLQDHTFPPNVPNLSLMSRDKTYQGLKKLLLETRKP